MGYFKKTVLVSPDVYTTAIGPEGGQQDGSVLNPQFPKGNIKVGGDNLQGIEKSSGTNLEEKGIFLVIFLIIVKYVCNQI